MLTRALGLKLNEPFQPMRHKLKMRRLDVVRKRQPNGFTVHDYQWYCVDGPPLWDSWQPDRIVWLDREDSFEMAASHFVAMQSKQWVTRTRGKFHLCPMALVRTYASLMASRPNVLGVLRGVPSTHTTYETLLREPDELTRVHEFLGLSSKTTPIADVTTRKSEWRDACDNVDQAREAYWATMRC